MTYKGQTSIEMLVILAVALLALLVFLMLSQNETLSLQQKKIDTEAANAVSDLAQGAADVYAQGIGAKKKVLITIPEGFEYSKSHIGNNAIVLHAAGSDYSEIVDFTIYGSLPQTSGKHWVWIESRGEQVIIGFSMVELDRISINTLMPRQNTIMEGLMIKSNWENPLNISIGKTWSSGTVAIDFDKSSLHLSHLSSTGLNIILKSNDNASGFASGSIDLFITDGVANESLSIPVTVEISGNSTAVSKIVISPPILNISAKPGDIKNGNIQVCTNAALDSVEFNISDETAGDWIAGLESLGAMEKDSCQPKTFEINVPNNASDGIYTGHIYAIGHGIKTTSASTLVMINVATEFDDGIGPKISQIKSNPERISSPEPVTISAYIEDNNTIEKCMLRNLEQDSWVTMDASDFEYDQNVETVKYEFFGGFEIGDQKFVIECFDKYGNSAQKTFGFEVMKDILFVKKSNVETTSEASWISWINNHKSGQGNTWSMDIIKSADLINSKTDTSFYSTVVFGEWDSALAGSANTHIANKGYVVLLGESAIRGPRDLGLTNKIGETNSIDSINILTNNSFITEQFIPGSIVIADNPTLICGVDEYAGTVLASWEQVTLGQEKNILLWGVQRPDELNHLGGNLSVRVLDYAIGESQIVPGGLE